VSLLAGSVHLAALWFETQKVELDASRADFSFFSGKALLNASPFGSSFTRAGEMNLASEREVLQ
jgi:hypothetical protein